MQPQRAPRFATDIPVAVRHLEEEGRRVGRVKNVSEGGMLLVDPLAPAPGGSVAIEIPASAGFGRVLVLAEVAWREGQEAGLRLLGMLPHHRNRFHRLLASLGGTLPLG